MKIARHNFKVGDEVTVVRLVEGGQFYYSEYTLGRCGKVINLDHPENWIAIQGIVKDDTQLWVHPDGVVYTTPLQELL